MAWIAILAVVFGAVGAAFVAVVPAGLPYDEPAHWEVVRYVATHWSMPVIGRDAGYEAQQGPVAYFLDAALLRASTALEFPPEVGFFVVRASGMVLLVGLAALVVTAVRRSLPDLPLPALVGGAVVALGNPMVVGMAMSVQNDLLALVLGAAALVAGQRDGPSPRALTAGLLAGAAVLTKLTAWPVVVTLVLLYLLRRRPRQALIFVASGAAVSAWWFVRNLSLYGDLTGQRGVEAAGYRFPAAGLSGLGGPVGLARQLVTYLWVPTEYYRNSISSPAVLDVALVALTAVIGVVGVVAAARRARPGLLAAVTVLAVAGWLVTFVLVQAVAPRLAYAGLVGWAALAALTTNVWRPRLLALCASVAVVLLNVAVLVAVHRTDVPVLLVLH